LFEVGILSKTPRSGFHFLGSGKQSVAEHINRVVFIGYSLASLEKDVNVLKIIKMCLLHDLHESRISDHNYVHQKYVKCDEVKVLNELTDDLPFGKDIKDIVEEYEKRETKESILAKEADNLEWILCLKEQFDNGNTKARSWIDSAVKRLKTDVAKEIAEGILKSHSDNWWFSNKEDSWWVNRDKG